MTWTILVLVLGIALYMFGGMLFKGDSKKPTAGNIYAKKALKIVDKDSSLGFEPSMGYGGDRAHIEWKIRQVEHMMTHELAIYENGLKF